MKQPLKKVALPVGKLVEGTRSEGAKVGGFWRINFSRVEWTVLQVADQKFARCLILS